MEDSAKPDPTNKSAKKSKNLLRRLGKNGWLIVILLLAIGSAVFFYQKYQDSQNKLKHPEIVAQKSADSLTVKVGRHFDLPTGERPTVATISDVTKLSGQTFFNRAKNGDKVLIYSKADTAILYRPSTDKIINVASLNTGAPTATSQ